VLKTIPDWAVRLAEASGPTVDPRLGSLRHLDTAARLRGLAAVERGEVVAMGRPLQVSGGQSHTGRLPFELEVEVLDNNALTVGTDRAAIDCHGLGVTHMDGINHFGVRGRWFGGADARAAGPSIADWARAGLVTRGILLDIPAVRDGRPVEVSEPVGPADLERALELSSAQIEPGDALLVYMGRDPFEREHGPLQPIAQSPAGRPGIGDVGAQWLGDRPVAAVLWDMLDAYSEEQEPFCVHLLVWAQGLALVDNCDLEAARAALAGKRVKTGLVMVAPLNIPGGTGSAVNPLLLY
jgi:kynurenine formamidase